MLGTLCFASAVAVTATAEKMLIADGLVIARISGTSYSLVRQPSSPTLPSNVLTEILLWGNGPSHEASGLFPEEVVGEGFYVQYPDDQWHNGVYLSGGRASWPRDMTLVSPNDSRLPGIVSDWLKVKGFSRVNKANIRAILVDMEGDGDQELIIEATCHDSPSFEPTIGDYAMVIICYDGFRAQKRETLLLDVVQDEGYLYQHNYIRSVADIDDDGDYELIVNSDYYEGNSTSVWRIGSERIRKLAEMGVGV